jgi:molybdate transport system regulatory protein
MTTNTRLDLRLRILFEPGGPPLGPGKIDLLEHIAARGSLARAAEELGMSYRRAWALIQELAQMFGQPVVLTTVGGASGGGAELTPFANRLVSAYRSVERATLAAVSDEFAFAVRARTTRRRGTARRVKRTGRGSAPARSRRRSRARRGAPS